MFEEEDRKAAAQTAVETAGLIMAQANSVRKARDNLGSLVRSQDLTKEEAAEATEKYDKDLSKLLEDGGKFMVAAAHLTMEASSSGPRPQERVTAAVQDVRSTWI